MEARPPLGVMPAERIAIFIDGTNFKYATYDSFQMRVDFSKLLRYFSQNSILLRAYYYTGEWDDGGITQFLRLAEPFDPVLKRGEMERQRDGDRKFWRFLDRNGFRVVRKPVRVFRDAQGDIRVKADLDLELAIDMLTLAERCEKQILVSGDGDFVPLVHAVAARGVRVAVVTTQSEEAYRNAHYRASDDLLDAADEFISIESIRTEIEREWYGQNGRTFGASAPPVPPVVSAAAAAAAEMHAAERAAHPNALHTERIYPGGPADRTTFVGPATPLGEPTPLGGTEQSAAAASDDGHDHAGTPD